MKMLLSEYFDSIITFVGGLIILSIIINFCVKTNISINHNEDLNNLNPIIEKIGNFDCKDIIISNLDDSVCKNLSAYSNTGKDISDYVISKLKEENGHYFVEHILKYNNDFMIKRVNCYLQEEEEENEDDV